METIDSIRHGGFDQDGNDSSTEKSPGTLWGIVLMILAFLAVMITLVLLLL